jgi:preprotein translocase subunit SecB
MENPDRTRGERKPERPDAPVQSVYLKDCSYEAPKGPRVEGNWSPQISLDINTTANVVRPSARVVLTVTVGAKQGEATAFLVEVKQAGLFVMRGLTPEDTRRAIGTICPNVFVPVRARRRVAARDAGRLPELRAAAGRLRPAVRARHAAGAPAQAGSQGPAMSRPGSHATVATSRFAVLGAGSWGTALAIQFARAGSSHAPVDAQHRRRRRHARERRNRRYLPRRSSRTPSRSTRTSPAVHGAVAIILACPVTRCARCSAAEAAAGARRAPRLGTKGFELDTGKLPHQVRVRGARR